MGLLAHLFGAEKRVVTPLSGVSVGDVEGMKGAFALAGDHDTNWQAVTERCRSLISQTTASVPLTIMRRLPDGGSEEIAGHPLARVLNEEASDGVTSFSVREGLARDVCSYGNALAEVLRNGRGAVEGLRYWPWERTLPEILPSGRLRWRVTDPVGSQRVLLASEVVHLRYATRDGLLGVPPLEWARTSSGLIAAQSSLARAQVERGFVPDVAFESDQTFEDEKMGNVAFQRLKDQLTERLGRMWRNPTALLLEAGLKAKPLAAPGREQQFHESRITGLEDIARAFGVPLSVVGLGRNASYGSLTEESRSLLRDCIGPWAARIESQLGLALLTREERATLRLEHDLSGLQRGDMQARFTAYGIGIRSGFLLPNDPRRWEGLTKIEGGDVPFRPTNREPAAAPAGASGQAS